MHVQCEVKIANASLQPVYTHTFAVVPKKTVHLVLVHDVFKPSYQRTGHKTRLVAHLAFKDVVYVYGFLHNVVLSKQY